MSILIIRVFLCLLHCVVGLLASGGESQRAVNPPVRLSYMKARVDSIERKLPPVGADFVEGSERELEFFIGPAPSLSKAEVAVRPHASVPSLTQLWVAEQSNRVLEQAPKSQVAQHLRQDSLHQDSFGDEEEALELFQAFPLGVLDKGDVADDEDASCDNSGQKGNQALVQSRQKAFSSPHCSPQIKHQRRAPTPEQVACGSNTENRFVLSSPAEQQVGVVESAVPEEQHSGDDDVKRRRGASVFGGPLQSIMTGDSSAGECLHHPHVPDVSNTAIVASRQGQALGGATALNPMPRVTQKTQSCWDVIAGFLCCGSKQAKEKQNEVS